MPASNIENSKDREKVTQPAEYKEGRLPDMEKYSLDRKKSQQTTHKVDTPYDVKEDKEPDRTA